MTEVRSETPASFTDPIAVLRRALRGRYEIERQIGQGAYATVYLARDLKHERKVAIKVLSADPQSETGEIRFIREIRLVARLQHPNILPLHDSGHVEALLYYVMPYVEGETLRVRMHRERQMAIESACSIARETADALAYAHKQGIVHRDIKPENILLSGGHAVVADFGIARAIDVAGVKQLTVTGVAGPGTPAYMSPEQLLGDRGVDVRSDIYSLGCVLYEMLAGKPPFPGKDGFVKRFTEPPPHISSLRRDSPPWIDETIAKALAKDPAHRFATATDFVGALCQPTETVRTPRKSTPIKHALVSPPLFEADPLEAEEMGAAFPDSYPSGGRKRGLAGPVPGGVSRAERLIASVRTHPMRSGLVAMTLIAGVLALGAFGVVAPLSAILGNAATIDSNRLVIIPFTSGDGNGPGSGSYVSEQLYDAVTRWEGVPLVPDTRVAQAISERGSPPKTEADAFELARQLNAGRLIWGHTSGPPRQSRVRVHLYDVASRQSQDEFVFVDSTGDNRLYEPTALRLLKVRNRPPEADDGDRFTRSYPAWTAYGMGHVALKQWDLGGAERHFRDAVAADAAYAPARLWLAQVLEWATSARDGEWQDQITRFVPNEGNLAQRDMLIAQGLRALAERRYPEACDRYTSLLAIDSLHFVGHYGLGECLSLDSLVVPSRSSPSGWHFRSSSRRAVAAFMRALRLEPGAHAILAYERLQILLPTNPTKIRVGKSHPDGKTFAAYPTLINDTLGFIPYPLERFAQLPSAELRSRMAALDRNSAILSEFAAAWTRHSPRSAAAHEALATALDASGDRLRGGPSPVSSVDALRTARSLASERRQRLRLAAFEVWLLVKRNGFTQAAALADSLLEANRSVDIADAGTLVSIAALIGRIGQTAELAQTAGLFLPQSNAPFPLPIRKVSAALHAYAAVGACDRHLRTLESELDRELSIHVPDDQRAQLRTDIRARPLSMLADCPLAAPGALTPANPDRLQRMQTAYARGRIREVREHFDSLSFLRRGFRPADVTLDYTYQEAWLRAAIGDTAVAIEQLNKALGSLPTRSSLSFQEPGAAAALGRAMALRSDLARATGDSRTARYWASAVAALWGEADPPLQPTVARMRSSARQP